MLTSVQRIILKAKPAKSHPEFNEWETATLVYFINDSNKRKALKIVRQNMSLNHWEILYYESNSTLIEEMVLSAEKEIVNAYDYAKKNKIRPGSAVNGNLAHTKYCLFPSSQSKPRFRLQKNHVYSKAKKFYTVNA